MTFQEIKNKIENSYSVDFGTIFNQSIELFKKTWVQGLIMTLLMMVSVFALEMLIIVPFSLFAVGSSFVDVEAMKGLSVFVIFLLIIAVLIFVSMIMTITVGLMGGLYIIYKKADHNEMYSTNDFFTLLRKDKIVKTFKIAVMQFLVSILFVMMCYFPIFYAMIPISYFVVIYAYNHELSAREVVKLSFAIGNKNWVQTFLLRLVTGIVAMFGIILCGVGLLVTFALVLIPQYFVYKQVVGFEDNNEMNSIGSTEEI